MTKKKERNDANKNEYIILESPLHGKLFIDLILLAINMGKKIDFVHMQIYSREKN
jgi:hypothetical protein